MAAVLTMLWWCLRTYYFQLRESYLLNSILNETLGFERIYAIGLPERTDKRDALTLASALTGLSLTWVPGVDGTTVSSKAAPPPWDYERRASGTLGCWRAHLNVIEQVVREQVATALILEDDADWDVTVKLQFGQFAGAVQALQAESRSHTSPYGSGWDFLWLAHNRIAISGSIQDMSILENDLTVPAVPLRHSWWMQKVIPWPVSQNRTRCAFRATDGTGGTGYAVTLAAAQKILASLSVQGPNLSIDQGYSQMCSAKRTPALKCFAPYPPLIGVHRAAGPRSRDSDISNSSDTWHNAYSRDIVDSTMLNIQELAAGKHIIKAQRLGVSQRQHPMLSSFDQPEFRLIQVEPAKMPIEYVDGINSNFKSWS